MKHYSIIKNHTDSNDFSLAVTTGFRHKDHITDLPKDDNGNYVRQKDEIDLIEFQDSNGKLFKQAFWNKQKRIIKENTQKLKETNKKQKESNRKTLRDNLKTIEVDSINNMNQLKGVLKDVIKLLT